VKYNGHLRSASSAVTTEWRTEAQLFRDRALGASVQTKAESVAFGPTANGQS